MSQIRLGVGNLQFYSFWVKAYSEKEGLVWEGIVDGRPERRKDNQIMLRLDNNTIPIELNEAFQKYGTLRTEWEPAWEEVETKQLTEEITVQDEDNQAASKGN